MSTTRSRSIHTIAKSIWDNSALKTKIDRQIWTTAKETATVAQKLPLVEHGGVCPARLHADFTRMMRGKNCEFPETIPAINNLRTTLRELGFTPNTKDRFCFSPQYGIAGEVDAHGVVDDCHPAIIELKVVRFLPQVVRAADAVQLLLYELAHKGCIGSTMLIGLYVQPQAPFRTALRLVFEPKSLEPLVLEIAA